MKEDAIKLVDKLSDYMDKSAAKFGDKILSYLKQAGSEAFENWLQTLDVVDGKIVANYDAISRLEQSLLQPLNATQYNNIILDFFYNYDTVLKNNKQIQKAANDLEVDETKLVTLTEKQRVLQERVIYELKQGGIKLSYVEPTKKAAFDAIAFGDSIASAKARLKETYKGKAISSRLEQIARDGIFTYNGIVNEAIAETYDLKKVYYGGGLVSDSRPFCIRCANKTLEIGEIKSIVKTYLASPELSKGMYSVPASEYNIFIYRGGWNCLHIAIPTK